MTFVVPPPPVEASAVLQPATRGPVNLPAQPQSVVVLELPQALTAVERAILLSGTVIDQQSSAQGILATVRTQLGDLLLQVTTPLPTGRPLTLQIQPGNPPQTALVDLPAGGAGPANAPVPPPAAAATPAVVANIGAPAAPLLPGALLEVLQLPNLVASAAATQPAANPLPAPGTPAPAAPATPASAATSTTPANAAPALTTPTATPASPAVPVALRGAGAALFAQTVGAEAAPTPTATTASTVTLTPSQTSAPLGVRVVQILPPGTPVPALPAGGDQFAATVGTARAGGFPVATTPDGQTIALQTNARVDPGSVLVLQRLPAPVAAGEAPLLPLDPIQGNEWPALAQALRTLALTDPAAAAQLRAGIPGPTTNLAPAMLFVAAALRLGDPRALFGTAAIDALKRTGKGNVTERLFGDFEAASGRAADLQGAQWRSYPIPMQENDGRIAMMQLHVRRDDQPDIGDREASSRDDGEGKRTRFLLDIAPSALGPIQLDGLVRPSAVSPLVDLVVRTKQPLPDAMRRDIAGIWTEALSVTGAKGALVFQANATNWVDTTGFRGLGHEVGLSA
ncbi:MAG: hypothetical protein JWM77_1781 [Rhodospirillales bacterium]|nr:hypothetical protein [Rhodospirillales bacterium]